MNASVGRRVLSCGERAFQEGSSLSTGVVSGVSQSLVQRSRPCLVGTTGQQGWLWVGDGYPQKWLPGVKTLPLSLNHQPYF